jgi:hypothetical protein
MLHYNTSNMISFKMHTLLKQDKNYIDLFLNLTHKNVLIYIESSVLVYQICLFQLSVLYFRKYHKHMTRSIEKTIDCQTSSYPR